MKKQLVCLLLAALMALSLCTAGAEAVVNADSQWPVVTDGDYAINLAVCVLGTDGPVEDMWFFKWLEQVSGVKINVTGITKDAWEARKNLIMSSGNLADVYWGFNWSPTDLYNYGAEGDFLALNDVIEKYGKNLKVIDDYIGHSNFLGLATAPDGNIYSVPVMTEPNVDMLNRTTYGMSINTEMLKQIGAEIPKTLEELYDVLVKMNEAGLNGTISAAYDAEFRSLTLAAYQIITDGEVQNNINLKQTAQGVWKPVFTPLEQEYKAWLTMLNKFYTAGLIDPAFFTTDTITRAAKNQENPAAVIVTSLDQSLGEYPDIFRQYQVFLLNEDAALAPITYNVGHTAVGGFVITSECQRPDIAYALIDRLYDPYVMLTLTWGPYMEDPVQYTDLAKEYGVGYEITRYEDGRWKGEALTPIVEQHLEISNWDYMRAKMSPSSAYNTFYPVSGLYARVTLYGAPARDVGVPEEKASAWFRTQQQANLPYIAYKFPNVYLSLDENERALELKGEIEDYVYSMEGRFISGELSIDENYDAFVEKLKALGAEEYLAIYANAYAALGD